MTCSELYHGQLLTVLIILFRGASSKYFTDLIARLLMCFVCISIKAKIVRIFLVYSANGIGNMRKSFLILFYSPFQALLTSCGMNKNVIHNVVYVVFI
jgi:hypothetical protein